MVADEGVEPEVSVSVDCITVKVFGNVVRRNEVCSPTLILMVVNSFEKADTLSGVLSLTVLLYSTISEKVCTDIPTNNPEVGLNVTVA